MNLSFTDRVAVVTGAGAGLGRVYALELARRGCRVIVNDLGGSGAGQGSDASAAAAVVREITASGGIAVANTDSVATRNSGRAIVSAALDTFGRLDILICNAGILRTGRFDELSDDAIDAIIDVYLKGAFYVGQPAFAAMKARRYGRILFTTSSSGLLGHPWQASYGAAKAGVVGQSNVIALEGRAFGVLSNVIMPVAKTRLADEIDWRWTVEVPDVGALMNRLGTAATAHRLDPSWVAALAVFLVSERSKPSHGVFSAVRGRYARVFTGITDGWTAAEFPHAEEFGNQWEKICDTTTYTEPLSVYHEAEHVARSLEQLRPARDDYDPVR